ncbi:MAG: hypothetical protein OXM00_09130, partial [Paracoccaceae bacterium]|nr:hypothetical protein [Paracoccaceae bacterium]
MTIRLSASGVRIRGDEYQHLVTWWQALRAVTETSDIIQIGVEDPKAGNADDVTVYMKNGRREYYQVKASGDANNPLGMAWLMKPSKAGGPSTLQRFYRLWAGEPNGHKPKIIVVANRLPPNGDVLNKRDGRDCTLVRHLQSMKPKPNTDHILHNLAKHLMADENKVVQFFHDLQFKLGISDDWLIEWTRERMHMAGLHHDEDAVARGISIARGWVTGGKREITTAELRQVVGGGGRPAPPGPPPPIFKRGLGGGAGGGGGGGGV